MTCSEARVALLEADLAELRGETESGLAGHLRGCAACRAVAGAIVAAEAGAAEWITTRVPHRSTAAVMMAGRTAAARRPRWRGRWLVPLAAAAGLAALVLTWPDGPAGRRGAGAATPPPSPASRIAVEAPAGRSVAVFESTEPNVVIIWFY